MAILSLPGEDFTFAGSPVRRLRHRRVLRQGLSSIRDDMAAQDLQALQSRIVQLEEQLRVRSGITGAQERSITERPLSSRYNLSGLADPYTRISTSRPSTSGLPALSFQNHSNSLQPSTHPTGVEQRPRAKANPPPVFEGPPHDVRLWIMEMNDFLNVNSITDLGLKAATAISYLGQTIKARTQLLRMNGHLKGVFENWELTQEWLLDNYFSLSAGLDAELKMDKLRMYKKESVQDFINRFETVLSDLTWNDSATCAMFRKKLSGEVLDDILTAHSNGWPDTFVEMKKAAQKAENHLKITKRAREDREDHYNQGGSKRVRFQEGSKSPFTEANGKGFRPGSPNNRKVLSEEERKTRKHRRDNGLCMKCGKKNHWARDCPEAKNDTQ
ncbi:hypothetical protein MMC27_005433 [Xylographa pallens]|nr:hypothetical protein [Xylographa pallens]